MSGEVPKTVRIERDKPEPFEIIEEAGAGGMGTVYKARDRDTGQLLAVKVLNKDVGADITRFALEADILSKLKHPVIVEYRHHGLTKSGNPYLAMEWIDGENLERKLAAGVLSVEESLRIARSIADALTIAHAAGVIHRDLKPTNVLLTRETQAVKLVDFGIARSDQVEGLTQTGQALGTPGYMSPEQARGAKVDARSDLFSIGCILFRCLGGRRPFGGSDLMQFATNLALHDAPRLREIAKDIPASVEALVARLLQKDPASRPESADQLRRAIDRITDAVDATHPAETARAPTAEPAGETARSPGNEDAPAITPGPAAGRGDARERVREAAPKSSDPPDGPTLVSTAAQRRFDWRLVAMGAVALVAIAVVLVRELGEKTTTPSSAPRTAASAAPSAPAPPVVVDERASLDRACRNWSTVVSKAQHPDGSFSGETHAAPSGWDTAQQLFALVEARRACDEIGAVPIASGVRALEKLRTTNGWLAPADQEHDTHGVTPANAWAVLALDAVVRDMPPDPATQKLAATARAELLRAKNADGGFRYRPERPGPSVAYTTMLAAWALSDAGAIAWLVKETIAGTQGTRDVGFAEQLAWVLSRNARNTNTNATEEAQRVLARELIAHCRPDASGICSKPPHETGRLALELDGGRELVTLWHPWATVAAHEVSRSPKLGDADAAKTLKGMRDWGAGEIGRSIDQLAAVPEYKLAEYLMVVSELLLSR